MAKNSNQILFSDTPFSGSLEDEKEKVASVFQYNLFTKRIILASSPDGCINIELKCSKCRQCFVHELRANTKILKHHFKTKHALCLIKEGEAAHKAIQDGKAQIQETILGTDLLDGLKICGRPVSELYPKTPKFFTETFKRKRKGEFDVEIFRNKFIRMVEANNLPAEFCDDPETKDCLEYVRPGLQDVISLQIIDRYTNRVPEQEIRDFKKELAETDSRIALSVNEWESSSGIEYYGITCHFHDDDLELKRYRIFSEEVSIARSITGDLLKARLLNVLREHKIEDRIVSISRADYGSVGILLDEFVAHHEIMPGFIGEIRCVRDVVDLATHEILSYTNFRINETTDFARFKFEIDRAHPNLEEFLLNNWTLPRTIRMIIRGINDNQLLALIFAELVERQKMRENRSDGPETLFLDNETEWLSTYKMIERFLHFQKEINAFLERYKLFDSRERERFEIDVVAISDSEWGNLTNLYRVLQIFVTPTIELQASERLTINMTFPHIFRLLETLKSINNPTLGAENPYLARGILEAYKRIYSHYPLYEANCEDLITLCICTALDPRFKLAYFEYTNLSSEFKKKLKSRLQSLYTRYKQEQEKKERLSQRDRFLRDLSMFHTHSHPDAFPINDNIFMHDKLYEDDDDDLSAYLSARREKSLKDVVGSYHSIKGRYPVLYNMARDFLAIPAMATPAATSSSG
ncbi:protein of unknown function DUF4413 [Metschnikowia aff. pulcherrima]|uniref:HAT family C-terminal dimerization region n=1 Tax=Metschnikowia aff. pulcherrima TaxID=2163413 RepID=A0A4P6XY67_9ASCO|nr:protein of unknown function DUF4413 [Metschnikowia aff. pulcherrima]